MEEANIDYHQLKGREATKMRGRSKVVFQKKEKNSLDGIDLDEDKAAWCFAIKAEWYRQTAGQHNRLSNILISIAKQMKAAVKSGSGQREKEQSNAMITNTLKSYIKLAAKLSKKSQLNDTHKEQVATQWINLNRIYLDEKGNNIKP